MLALLLRITLLLSLLAIISLISVDAVTRCNLDTQDEHAHRVTKGKDLMKKAKAKVKSKATATAYYEIRMIVNIITNASGSEGTVPLDSLQSQIVSTNQVLSGAANTRGTAFDSYIRVVLAGVTYTNNSDYFYNCEDYTTAGYMRFYTALSSATTMNVWSCYSADLLGWVEYLPYELSQYSVWNGITLNYRAFPPSTVVPSYPVYPQYNLGHTVTHEFGHYLGLLHTFGNGIDGCEYGDDIADTPPEKTPAYGTPCFDNPPRKTCPGTPGVDPVWNLMDYSDDICTQEFSPDQVSVMRLSVTEYRSSVIAGEPFRCVTTGDRGPARPMTVCKSICYSDRMAPDGRAAPSSGWCRTDIYGHWGECCCGNSCFGTMLDPPPTFLECGKVQVREELLRPSANTTTCMIADIGGSQLSFTTCLDSTFARWAVGADGTVESIGTGWCLSVLNYNTPTTVKGKAVGLLPCQDYNVDYQTWTVLPTQKNKLLSGTLALQSAPSYCLDVSDGTFQMKDCLGDPTQSFTRVNNPKCGTLKTRVACLASATVLGCGCRWVSGQCMS